MIVFRLAKLARLKLEADPSCVSMENYIDWVGNTNAMVFSCVLGQSLPQVEAYLYKVVRRNPQRV